MIRPLSQRLLNEAFNNPLRRALLYSMMIVTAMKKPGTMKRRKKLAARELRSLRRKRRLSLSVRLAEESLIWTRTGLEAEMPGKSRSRKAQGRLTCSSTWKPEQCWILNGRKMTTDSFFYLCNVRTTFFIYGGCMRNSVEGYV